MSSDLVLEFVIVLPLLLVSLVAHELAHGWVADRLGDRTARSLGRLTLNPLAHLDLFGTLMLVVSFFGSGGRFFFGWAKPVPVDQWRFRDPQRGMQLVGLAGPAANLLLAAVAGALTWAVIPFSAFAANVLALAYVLNVVLALLNLLPVPPLDGARVVGGFLPRHLYLRWLALDRYGNWVFVIILAVMILRPEVFRSTIGAVLGLALRLLP